MFYHIIMLLIGIIAIGVIIGLIAAIVRFILRITKR